MREENTVSNGDHEPSPPRSTPSIVLRRRGAGVPAGNLRGSRSRMTRVPVLDAGTGAAGNAAHGCASDLTTRVPRSSRSTSLRGGSLGVALHASGGEPAQPVSRSTHDRGNQVAYYFSGSIVCHVENAEARVGIASRYGLVSRVR